jgi:hypothetical protein
MHEISLGYSIQDYLSGDQVEATTFEDIRQAMAAMLVERKGYPRDNLAAKVPVEFSIDGRPYRKQVDLVAFNQAGEPLLLLIFCAGEVETFIRQVLAAARLLPQGPARLAVVTDTTAALLLRVADGEVLEKSAYQAIPDWTRLQELCSQLSPIQISDKQRACEERIFYAFSELSCSCSDDSCDI